MAGFQTKVFNKCLDCGNYPDILKIAKVVPVHKNGTRHCVSNYRPISILSPINKLFETLLHKRLTEFFDIYNLFYDNQFGFRKKHSTNLAITHFYETILEHRDSNLLASSVFLDLAKAFDTVNHEILLSKLSRYGVRRILLKLLESYLINRYQYVEAGGCCKSVTLPITVGVPQGSVLGPFLFLVYINDFANCFENAQLVLYADNAVLINKSTTLSGLIAKTQTNLNAAIEWTRSNALAFNSNKTKIIIFANTTDYTYPNIKINIGEIAIHPQETFNYLGVIIDSQLKWKEHTQLVTKKLGASCGIVYKIKKYLPPGTPRGGQKGSSPGSPETQRGPGFRIVKIECKTTAYGRH